MDFNFRCFFQVLLSLAAAVAVMFLLSFKNVDASDIFNAEIVGHDWETQGLVQISCDDFEKCQIKLGVDGYFNSSQISQVISLNENQKNFVCFDVRFLSETTYRDNLSFFWMSVEQVIRFQTSKNNNWQTVCIPLQKSQPVELSFGIYIPPNLSISSSAEIKNLQISSEILAGSNHFFCSAQITNPEIFDEGNNQLSITFTTDSQNNCQPAQYIIKSSESQIVTLEDWSKATYVTKWSRSHSHKTNLQAPGIDNQVEDLIIFDPTEQDVFFATQACDWLDNCGEFVSFKINLEALPVSTLTPTPTPTPVVISIAASGISSSSTGSTQQTLPAPTIVKNNNSIKAPVKKNSPSKQPSNTPTPAVLSAKSKSTDQPNITSKFPLFQPKAVLIISILGFISSSISGARLVFQKGVFA